MKKIIFLTLFSQSFNVIQSAFFVTTRKHIVLVKTMAKTDSSMEIQEALRLSKKFGPNSKEAKVAWDIVEEIDASDNVRYEVINLDIVTSIPLF